MLITILLGIMTSRLQKDTNIVESLDIDLQIVTRGQL